jgi:hypothetical protein
MCAGIKGWKHAANAIRQYINSMPEQNAFSIHTSSYKERMFKEVPEAKTKESE